MKKKNRLLSSLLVALSLFVAAMPAQAASSQYVDIYEYQTIAQTNYHEGSSVFYYVHNIPYVPQRGDVYWELVDWYGNVLDSGTVYDNNDGRYYENTLDLSGISPQKVKLVLYCDTTCRADGYIQTYD